MAFDIKQKILDLIYFFEIDNFKSICHAKQSRFKKFRDQACFDR